MSALAERNSISAVVVSYNPDETFPERLQALEPQVSQIIIVDNNSNLAVKSILRRIASERGYCLLENQENVGVAAGLNQGIGAAQAGVGTWVVTMDQDTIPLANMTQILLDAWKHCETTHNIAIIGSNYSGRARAMSATTNSNDGAQLAKTVITAGSLISIEAFYKVEGFRQELFIDGVDEDFCLRLRRSGYSILRANSVGIIQPIGAQTRHNLLGREVGVSNHSPTRHYYMTRNRSVLIARHMRFDPTWCFSQLFVQMKMIALVTLFEADKIAKLRAMALGFCHALVGRTGRLTDAGLERSI
jgi:rhamnosyltransferase